MSKDYLNISDNTSQEVLYNRANCKKEDKL